MPVSMSILWKLQKLQTLKKTISTIKLQCDKPVLNLLWHRTELNVFSWIHSSVPWFFECSSDCSFSIISIHFSSVVWLIKKWALQKWYKSLKHIQGVLKYTSFWGFILPFQKTPLIVGFLSLGKKNMVPFFLFCLLKTWSNALVLLLWDFAIMLIWCVISCCNVICIMINRKSIFMSLKIPL